MKKKLKNSSSQRLLEADFIKSLQRVFKRAERINSSEKVNSNPKEINRPPHNSISIMHSKKSSIPKMNSRTPSKSSVDMSQLNNERLINHYKNHVPKKDYDLQKELKEKEKYLLEKEKKIIEKEIFIKSYQEEIEKKNKEISKKCREIQIQKASIDRIVGDVIVSGIVNEMIWDSVFISLQRQEVCINSRKHACISSLRKMKTLVERLEKMKRELEKKALELITQKHLQSKKSANLKKPEPKPGKIEGKVWKNENSEKILKMTDARISRQLRNNSDTKLITEFSEKSLTKTPRISFRNHSSSNLFADSKRLKKNHSSSSIKF